MQTARAGQNSREKYEARASTLDVCKASAHGRLRVPVGTPHFCAWTMGRAAGGWEGHALAQSIGREVEIMHAALLACGGCPPVRRFSFSSEPLRNPIGDASLLRRFWRPNCGRKGMDGRQTGEDQPEGSRDQAPRRGRWSTSPPPRRTAIGGSRKMKGRNLSELGPTTVGRGRHPGGNRRHLNRNKKPYRREAEHHSTSDSRPQHQALTCTELIILLRCVAP